MRRDKSQGAAFLAAGFDFCGNMENVLSILNSL
jgi:hypothetical protein